MDLYFKMPDKLRVGIDASALSYEPTGVANNISRILETLVLQNVGITFFLYSTRKISFPPLPNVVFREMAGPMRVPVWAVWINTTLPIALLRDQIDIFWGGSGLVPLLAPPNMARVVTICDLVHHFAPQTQTLLNRLSQHWLQRLSALSADYVVSISEATAHDVKSIYGRASDAVIYPLAGGAFKRLPPEALNRILAKHGLPQRFNLIVGTLQPRKNIECFTRAYLDRFRAGVPLPLLVMVGGAGWRDSAINEAVSEAERAGIVRRLGYVDFGDLPALYGACDTFFLPSIYEGFGMPLLEAQRCGATVVHGEHLSMVEAAGGLGVVTSTDFASLCQMLEKYAQGELPLACRLFDDNTDDAQLAASRLWDALLTARLKRASRRGE